jgi:ubiquinone biosynthesis protein
MAPATLTHIRKLARIVRIMARYGVLDDARDAGITGWWYWPLRLVKRRETHLAPGQRLALALQKLGPAFIKLGQTLATRYDLVGETFARDLAMLQDKLPAFPFEQVSAIIRAEFGEGPETLYRRFDPVPVAAASIAQVHVAEVENGKKVAVKIARPGIALRFAEDIALFRWLAVVMSKNFPALRRLRLPRVVDTLEQSVRMELDLRLEAAAASEVAENLLLDEGIRVPAVDWGRTGATVMTMEWMEGIPLSALRTEDVPPEQAPVIVRNLMNGFFRMVFRDGFFHADLHPGNVFLQADGTLAMVDFGIMGRLDMQNRIYLAELIAGFLRRDYTAVAEMHCTAGYIPRNADVGAFAQACRSIAEPIMDLPLAEISVGKLLTQLFAITDTFQMETQPQLLFLQKSMMLIEGMARRIYPETNMWQLSEPPIREWMEQNLSLRGRVRQHWREMRQRLVRLPMMLDQLEVIVEREATKGEQPVRILASMSTLHGPTLHAPSLVIGALAMLCGALILLS